MLMRLSGSRYKLETALISMVRMDILHELGCFLNFSHEELKKIAGLPEFHDEWKTLARKLNFDSRIGEAERLATNGHVSPTEMMLRLWMLSSEASLDQLEQALTTMQKVAILKKLGLIESTDF